MSSSVYIKISMLCTFRFRCCVQADQLFSVVDGKRMFWARFLYGITLSLFAIMLKLSHIQKPCNQATSINWFIDLPVPKRLEDLLAGFYKYCSNYQAVFQCIAVKDSFFFLFIYIHFGDSKHFFHYLIWMRFVQIRNTSMSNGTSKVNIE